MNVGVEMDGEIIPYSYAIEKLHSIGDMILHQKTKDAVQLRVYETGKDFFHDYWVHPMFLTLQSFKFFKLFEEIMEDNEQEQEQEQEQEKDIIEIEVPNLQAFDFVLYFIYTGDNEKFNEIAETDSSFYKGIEEDIEYLEINMA
eukprot:jgi/Orpsp1_1/1189569/evm.model.d7180000072942.1